MEALMELSGVTKTFRSEPPVRPLDGLDLRVDAGQVVAVTGVSGKGKSTLLNVMGGLLKPDAGSILFKGEDVCRATSARLDALHRQGIGFVFQSPFLFQALTARENLVFARKAAGARIDDELHLTPPWRDSGWRTAPTICRASCPWGRSADWWWRVPCWRPTRSSSPTSRRTIWTAPGRIACFVASANSPRREDGRSSW